MEKSYKDTFVSDALKAGVVIGIAVFAVQLLSTMLKWQLSDHKMWESLAILVVLILGAAFFGMKRGEAAGKAGFTYGQCVGFLVTSMAFAGIIAGVGTILLHKVIAPDYYAQVIEQGMELAREKIASNPMLRGADSAAIDQSMEMSRKMAGNPIILFIQGLFSLVIIGTLISLFMAIFLKKPSDPFHEEGQQQPPKF